jgi:glycosidase
MIKAGNPFLYEINAYTFLSRMSSRYGRQLTLLEIPDKEWQEIAGKGFNMVWLMGVWQRSPLAKSLAINNKNLRQAYNFLLPGWTEKDICGSPYAIYDYSLDEHLGKKDDLALLKTKLNSLGLGLVLDFVPNHLALDHPWTRANPGRFVAATKKSLADHPEWFFRNGDGIYIAHGRDPYFLPWNDTAQVNFFSLDLRKAFITELLRIAGLCDGLRCDMAMLGLNDVFQWVWRDIFLKRAEPQVEFWTEVIGAVRNKYPDFIFMAEVYWGLDHRLLDLGFDYTYDKVFYDRLRYDKPDKVQQYVLFEGDKLKNMVHFIENHDEDRAQAAFGKERSLAAVTAIATVPGMRFFHAGQMEGYRQHIPVQMGREPDQPVDQEVAAYYEKLLKSCQAPAFRDGVWKPLEVRPSSRDNDSNRSLLCWSWDDGQQLKLVVINYCDFKSYGRVRPPILLKNAETVTCYDDLTGATYHSKASEVNELGLYIELKPWQSQILDINAE